MNESSNHVDTKLAQTRPIHKISPPNIANALENTKLKRLSTSSARAHTHTHVHVHTHWLKRQYWESLYRGSNGRKCHTKKGAQGQTSAYACFLCSGLPHI